MNVQFLRYLMICSVLFAGWAFANNPFESELDKQWDLLDNYCIDCHNFDENAGGLSLELYFPDSVSSEGQLWESVIKKLNAGMMPPPGENRPKSRSIKRFVSTLEKALDHEAAINPNPGSVVLHRLNRDEYANAVRDLLHVNIDPTLLLPRDDESHGFTNNASVLKVSPTFLEQSVLAAREVSLLAIGNKNAGPTEAVYPAPANVGQYVHIEGLPLGTRGGMLVEHYFPVDGIYEFSLNDLVGAVYVWGVLDPNTLIITLDGKKVFEQTLGGVEDLRAVDLQQASAVSQINSRFKNISIPVTAGPHEIGVTFVAKTAAETNEIFYNVTAVTGMTKKVQGNSYGPKLEKLIIKGPLESSDVGPTPSRNKIFICYPDPDSKKKEQWDCARKIISHLAARAFRRSVSDGEVNQLLDFYQQGFVEKGFESGIQKSLMAILANPKFLYRATANPHPESSSYPISDLALASRLSFFIWGSAPDEELLALANSDQLSEQAILQQQLHRMLADKKASALVDQFAFQWLNVQGLHQVEPDQSIYPQYTPDLIADFSTELRLFIADVLSKDKPITELLSSSSTYLNERLALHYGVKDIRGGKFRPYNWQNQQRFGLLGKGAVLMTTSYSNRTSPVVRGAYVLEKLMGVVPPPPPPNVEAFPENVAGADFKTVRDRLVMHREQKACNTCHAVIDPPGLALENYNAVGQWRDKDRDSGTAIDASGELLNGTGVNTRIDSPADLNKTLLANPEQFVQTFTERLFAYALGRGLAYYDMPTVRKIVRDAKRQDYRFSSIVEGIVNSSAFQMESQLALTETRH